MEFTEALTEWSLTQRPIKFSLLLYRLFFVKWLLTSELDESGFSRKLTENLKPVVYFLRYHFKAHNKMKTKNQKQRRLVASHRNAHKDI